MLDPAGSGSGSGSGSGEVRPSWKLNFDGVQLQPLDSKKKPERRRRRLLKNCLGSLLGTKDGVAEYYQRQRAVLEQFKEVDALTEFEGFTFPAEEEEFIRRLTYDRFAIKITNIGNAVLFAAKVCASAKSRSLAIIASTFDSLLDLIAGFILWFTASSMRTINLYRYPIGKTRMKTLGMLVFASFMAALGLQIIIESVKTLITEREKVDFTKEQVRWIIGLIVSVTVVRFILVIFCRLASNEIVKMYPHVVNDSVGLLVALLAKYTKHWIDPVGAIILALFTIRSWSLTLLENVKSLLGQSATPEQLQKLTYLCWNHHEAIQYIDTVRAYSFGSYYFVEVDIVLPPEMPSSESHNIGETLQVKLERLPEIERAFVHVDFECTHRPEHSVLSCF